MGFAASQSAFASALLEPSSPVPVGITSADPVRFAVYRNNVFAGLTTALAKRFPVVERLVGTEFFAGMARVYAGEEKPASPLLFEYGDSFPDFVAAFEPAMAVPYLADVARIEAAWMRAYHAEDAAPLTIADIAAIDAAAITQARLVRHPSAALLASSYPAGSIWGAHQGTTVEPLRTSEPETVLVIRPEMDVFVHILPKRDAPFAAALFRRETLGAAAETAMAAGSSFDFGTALVGLVSLGAFAAVTEEEEERT